MNYKAVSIEQLIEHEYAQVEGDLKQIKKSDLHSILPEGVTSSRFLAKVTQGEYLLLADTPSTPLLIHSTNTRAWQINPEAEIIFQSTSIAQLKQHITNTNQSALTSSQKNTPSSPQTSNTSSGNGASEKRKPPSRDPVACEYNMEIAFSEKAPNQPINLNVLLAEKDSKKTESDWQSKATKYGTKYTIRSNTNAPRKLNFRVANNTMGLSLNSVDMVSLGAGTVKDAFIPIMPTVQFGERLGFATTGYLYHFLDNRLIQEYKWIGKQGFSPLSISDTETPFNLVNNALLVYWKIAGKLVTGQYLVYQKERLSKSSRENTSSDWLKDIGIPLDIDAILAVTRSQILERDATVQGKEAPKSRSIKHTIQTSPITGKREALSEIAEQYGTTASELIKENPNYQSNLSALKVGTILLISQAQSRQTDTDQRFELPPESPSLYNNPYNSYYDCNDAHITVTNGTLILPLKKTSIKRGLPLVNIKPEKILRIGVFFDGIEQNTDNDKYKENNGDKSRSNIARLFKAYPQELGKSSKIYVSGVGTLDNAYQTPELIDKGSDETSLFDNFGLFDENGAYTKWQTLLKQLSSIVNELETEGQYKAITHITFDVFGFSLGAALARHFVNVLKIGLPNYKQPQRASNNSIHPNLLGGVNYSTYRPNNKQYEMDTTRTTSIRFLGLFETAGTVYSSENNKNNELQLTIQPKDVGRAFHIVAHHEYRNHFPLASLQQKGKLPSNFYEEVFPGAHKDVGGGYPFVKQYKVATLPPKYYKQYQAVALPEEYGKPTNNTYNRELVDVLNIQESDQPFEELKSLLIQWPQTCWDEFTQKGEVRIDQGVIYFYRLQPIDASVAGLSQERMKQQAAAFGVEWFEKEYRLPIDYKNNLAQQSLWASLKNMPLGSITPQHWQSNLPDHCIHRSHDTVINPGYDDSTQEQESANDITNKTNFIRYQPNAPLNTPTRTVYDND